MIENDKISTPSIANLADYLHYQYPATVGNVQLDQFCSQLLKSQIDAGAALIELLNQNAELHSLNKAYFKALKEIETIKGSPPFQVARTIAGRAIL